MTVEQRMVPRLSEPQAPPSSNVFLPALEQLVCGWQ
jgi:hypothetical protein